MSEINIYELMKIIPHRYPFLLIDKVLELKLGDSITAVKNITMNEPCFTGHFPENPVFPGVLITEALAQATGVLTFKTLGGVLDEGSYFLLAGFDNIRYKRQVIPGDVLTLKAQIKRRIKHVWKFDIQALVGDEIACAGETMGAMTKIQA